MEVNNINFYSLKSKNQSITNDNNNLSFRSNLRVVTDEAGKIINRNSTSFFRNDMDWDAFVSLLLNKYDNVGKVNLIDYACSDGSEAFSIVSFLLSNLEKGMAEKFLPIKAKDLDSEILNKAKSGICGVFDTDIKQLKTYLDNFEDFFKVIPYEGVDTNKAVSVAKEVKDKIIFEKADILSDLDSLHKDNNVILCRNLWKYLGEENYNTLAQKLYDKTKNNGLVVIGKYDLVNNVPKVLLANNFKSTFLPNVFEPNQTKAKSIQELLAELRM